MAIVKGLSLEAIRTLGEIVVFCAHKGQLVAKCRPLHFPKVRSAAVQLHQRRMKVANKYIKLFSADLIALYHSYTDATDWTWKDAFMHFFLTAWSANNAPPIVITDLSFEWDGADAKLNFKIADWYYGEDFGYGTDGYGTCPYGTPTDLTEDQPNTLIPHYKFAYRPPLPRPY